MASRKPREVTRDRTRVALHELSHLTEAQRAAVTHGDGPALVVAGAGTGKTRVLVERIAWLTKHRGVPPQNILALTFTDKAASELETRTDLALPISAFRPWVGTFHAFGEYVLREEALAIGLDPRFRILSAPEAWLLLKRNIFSLPLSQYRPLGNPTKFIQALVEFFGQAKDQGVTPEVLEQYAQTVNPTPLKLRGAGSEQGIGDRGRQDAAAWKELAGAYRAYVALQRQKGVLDFGDLLLETIRVFRERPVILEKVRRRFTEILVDEFQDTNATQLQLLELLAGRPGNLLVASDDDQAIFAFRGSNVGNVLQFRERYPDASLMVLTDNFRSPQDLLDAAYRMIQRNNPYRLEVTAGINKKLLARQQGIGNKEQAVEHRHFGTEEEEFAWVAEDILRLVDLGTAYREIAVLARTNAQVSDFASSLLRRDIPHTVSEARGLLARPEVKDALAYLRLLGTPHDAGALFRLITQPALTIAAADRARLLSALRLKPDAALPFLTRPELRVPLAAESQEGIDRLAALLEHHLTAFRLLRPSTVYLEFLERSGILRQAVRESERHPEVLPNLQAFLAYIRSLEQGISEGDFLEFLELLEAAADSGLGPRAADLSSETDAVHLLTVHAAKGLEFPVVFVIGATADRYPARGRRRLLELPPELVPTGAALEDLDEREAHVLEERRLFYVALTRAQQHLTITSSAAAAGSKTRRKPSPFIAETEIPSVAVRGKRASPSEQLSLPLASAPPPEPLRDNGLTLSASKISEYELCPLKYEFHYVLRVPTLPQHTLAFGNTIHAVLHRVGTTVASGEAPTLPEVLVWFDQHWISEGYESSAHEAARKEAGTAALRAYLTAHQELLRVPPLAVEVPFSFTLPTTRVTGRIDRIDRTQDPAKVVITDFKTGEGKGKDARTDTQLSIYAIAARKALNLEPARLRFAYVETGVEAETTRTPEEDAATVTHIEDTAARIRSGDFHPTPGYHCRFCDFRKICDYAASP
ncbi:MAG: ATP-dependent DNA helicase [bacterium]|nr:ATP-dependent DNA helicase [bacterium]